MLYYFWPPSICTADLLLVKLYHHPWLSWFVRSQWMELFQVTAELIDGNKSTFSVEKKDERDRSKWWGGRRGEGGNLVWLQLVIDQMCTLIWGLKCLDAVSCNCTLNCVTYLKEVRSSSGGLSFIFMFSIALSKLCRLCLHYQAVKCKRIGFGDWKLKVRSWCSPSTHTPTSQVVFFPEKSLVWSIVLNIHEA